MLPNVTKGKVFSLGFYRWRQALQVIRKKSHGRISPQDYLRRRMNQSLGLQALPSHFFTLNIFFLTSWKYRRLTIWLKTLNPKRHTAKHRYRKSLDVVRYPMKREWAKRKKWKLFPQKINGTVLTLVWFQNWNLDI